MPHAPHECFDSKILNPALAGFRILYFRDGISLERVISKKPLRNFGES
jgi:hypothetical protein